MPTDGVQRGSSCTRDCKGRRAAQIQRVLAIPRSKPPTGVISRIELPRGHVRAHRRELRVFGGRG
jgi:hypothetical protein